MIDVWHKAKPEWLLWVATRPGVLTDKELRLFAVFCARQVEHLLVDQRSRDAIAVAEKFANGEATPEELAAAWTAARDAARDAGRYAALAARAAASDAASDAAWAASDAAWVAARDAARDAQCDWLRKNTTPNFGGKKC
jgi:hypothetical protein